MTWQHLLTASLTRGVSARIETWGDPTNEDILQLIAHLHARIGARQNPPLSTSLTLPLAPANWAVLVATLPLTEDEWAQMHRVLEAMRPGLVEYAPLLPDTE